MSVFESLPQRTQLAIRLMGCETLEDLSTCGAATLALVKGVQPEDQAAVVEFMHQRALPWTTDHPKGWWLVEFRVNPEDLRPKFFPTPFPFWKAHFGEDYVIVIAFVRNVRQVYGFWKGARGVKTIPHMSKISYSERFQKPDWYRGEDE